MPMQSSTVCSVRGCKGHVLPESRNKMCDDCRGRHRTYANTKRARRKLEKAAAMGNLGVNTTIHWDSAIDPRLLSEPSQGTPLSIPNFDGSSTGRETESAVPHLVAGESVTQGSPIDDSTSSDTARRSCSVRGCKAEIPASHMFKMCNDCRSRYRTYGTTKRARSKAEREAFDRVLLELRIREDQRRQQAGEPPFAGSPEELRQWEFAVLNRTGPPPPATPSPTPSTSMTGQAHPHIEDTSISLGSLADQLSNKPALTLLHPTNALDPPHANSTYQIPTDESLPVRMCTVSHCRQVLPGSYRYKRCEQHRLQNRYHSNLKRLREKAISQDTEKLGAGETEGNASGLDKEPIGENDEEELMKNAMALAREGGGEKKGTGKATKRKFSCATVGCHNLLLPGARWRSCEFCRAHQRVLKKKKALEESTAKEVERSGEPLRVTEGDIGNLDAIASTPSIRDMSPNHEDITDMSGEKEGDSQDSEAVNTSESGVRDENAQGDGADAVISTAPGPLSAPAMTPPMSPSRPASSDPTHSTDSFTIISSTSQGPGTFQSVLRVNTNPSPVADATSQPVSNEIRTLGQPSGPPVTSTANILAPNVQSTIREYQSQDGVGTSITSIRRQNSPVPMSKGTMLPQNGENNSGLMGPSSFHVYKGRSLPPDSRSTLPLHSPPVYQPPAKKSRIANDRQSLDFDASQRPETTSQATASKTPHLETTHPVGIASTIGAPGTLHPTQFPTSSGAPVVGDAHGTAAVPSASPVVTRRRKTPPRAPAAPPAKPATSSTFHPYSTPYQHLYYLPPPYGSSSFGMPGTPFAPPSVPVPPSLTTRPAIHQTPYLYPYAARDYPPSPYYAAAPPYGYLPTRYPPNPYMQQLGPPYLSQHLYSPSYGYSKDALYLQHRPPSQSRPTVSAEATTSGKDRDEQHIVAANVVDPPCTVGATNAPSAPEPVSNSAQLRASVGMDAQANTGSSPVQEVAGSRQDRTRVNPSIRQCRIVSCRRSIPVDILTTLCEKCRTRMKKYRAKARHRFKLEPRKSVLGSIRAGSSGTAQKGGMVENAVP